MAEKEFQEILNEFSTNLHMGEDVYFKKFKEIRDARQAYRQIIPADSEDIVTNRNYRHGNDDSNNVKAASRAQYLVPILTAVADKIIQDVTTGNKRFEWEGNTSVGNVVARGIQKELLKVYTRENVKAEENFGLLHYVMSGTLISQTTTELVTPKRITEDKGIVELPSYRGINFRIYDPLRTIIDWNANPQDVSGTAQWAIVTIGDFTPDYIKDRWGVELQSDGNVISSRQPDFYKDTLENEAGVDKDNVITVREYYRNDGYRYTIAADQHLLEKKANENGIYGRIPINVCPIFPDPDCVYGMTLWQKLQPSIEVMSAAMNNMLDNDSLNNKMPMFTWRGLLEHSALTLNDFQPNEIVELDPERFLTKTAADLDISKAISKLQFPDITNSALTLYNLALQQIWYITGLNPATLGGIQEKQIRNESVAQMIQQSSLRNSSQIVVNLETYFMNPTTKDIAQIFELYYEDFNFQDKGITKDMFKELKNVRVVNGSYLPGDSMDRATKIAMVSQRAMQNPHTYNARTVEEDLIDSMGIGETDRYIKDPLEMISSAQAGQLLNMMNQMSPDEFAAFLQNMVVQQQQMEARGLA